MMLYVSEEILQNLSHLGKKIKWNPVVKEICEECSRNLFLGVHEYKESICLNNVTEFQPYFFKKF